MREVVHQPCGHPAEHRVTFLFLDVLLQLGQAVRHRVERGAELAELVGAADLDPRAELAGGNGESGALQRDNRVDEGTAEQVPGGHHRQQRG